MTLKGVYLSVRRVLRSQRGRNVIVFSVFLLIASFLWCVIALNDEGQADFRMPVRMIHVPDSVTVVSAVPQYVSVGVNARGSQLLKYSWSKPPFFDIDFRAFRDGSYLRLTDTDLKSIARQALGGLQVSVVSLDSLRISFTSRPPVILPVRLDCSVTPGPQVSLAGKPVLSTDSVKVYVAGHHSVDVSSISTEPIRLQSIDESVTRRVRLIAPPFCRVIPDSVEVTVKVEPLIFKTRRIPIQSINVPPGEKLVTFPSQIDVMYMIPVSDYLETAPRISVIADYNSISPSTGKVRLKIAEASDDLQNVHLASDSAEYIIEKIVR